MIAPYGTGRAGALPLVLASRSQSRQAMLAAAGVPFEAHPARIDERALESAMVNAAPAEIARTLAVAKAQAVSTDYADRWVLGSDSLVVVDGRRFDKPDDRAEAATHLRFFSGRKMELHSAAALVRNGHCAWDAVNTAILHVRALSEPFIQAYLDAEWPQVAGCVGVFRIEAHGVHLFDYIEGDHFTVLGMPLFEVLKALRGFEELAA